MKAVRADCRERLNGDDFQFVASALATRRGLAGSLVELLTDPAARDAALDSQKVLQALLESHAPVRVSPRLYFYVLARRSLGQFEREIVDYVAAVLAAFLETRQLDALAGESAGKVQYLVDLLATMAGAPTDRVFLIREHIGNYALFLSGIFPEHIQHRATVRGAPDIAYYERIGSANYRLAADHHLARQQNLTDVFRALADRFADLRRALNQLSDHLLCLEPAWNPGR